jgi:hypothetical protein
MQLDGAAACPRAGMKSRMVASTSPAKFYKKGNGPRARRRPVSNRGASKLGNEVAVCTLIMAVSKLAAMHNVAIVNLFNVLELPVLTSVCRNNGCGPTLLFIYFFGDEGESENFAFSIARHGQTFLQSDRRQSGFSRSNQHIEDLPDAWISDDGWVLPLTRRTDEPVDSVGLFVPPPQSPE